MKFAKKFWTPYESVETNSGEVIPKEKIIGKPFIVITEKDKSTYDYDEVGVIYITEVDGFGIVEAWPEEVEKGEQKKQMSIHGN